MSGRARLNWINTAMNLAFDIAKYRSQDLNTQVGACVLKNDDDIVLGYNGGPSGIEIDWNNREEKRKRVIHAESNVLSRIKTGEVKIFCVTHLPCLECLKIIAQKKIKTVYYSIILDNYNPDEVFKIAAEFGIELVQIKKEEPKFGYNFISFGDYQIHDDYKNPLPFISPGFQPWMEKLPIPSHIGRKVKLKNGEIKIVQHHWINLDDCSGGYGDHLYSFTNDENAFNNSMATKVKDCELLDCL